MRTEVKQYNFQLPNKQMLDMKRKRSQRLTLGGMIAMFIGTVGGLAIGIALLVSLPDSPHLVFTALILGAITVIGGLISFITGIVMAGKGYEEQYQMYCVNVYQGKVLSKLHDASTDTWSILMAGSTLHNDLMSTWMEVDEVLWNSIEHDDYIELPLPKGLKPADT